MDQTKQPTMPDAAGVSDSTIAQTAQNIAVAINNLSDPVKLAEAIINISSSGPATVIATQSGKTNKVYSLFFTVSAVVDITFQSGETTLTGPVTFVAAGSQMFLDFRPQPWFTCNANDPFILNLSGPAQVSGRAYYAAT